MAAFQRVMTLAVAGAFAGGLLTGCAKPPDQELTTAQKALEAARAVEAEAYLPAEYRRAQEGLDSAQAVIARQNKAFVLARNYAEAEKYLEVATALAEKMQNGIGTAKEAMKVEVTEELALAKEKIEEARKDVKRAPRSKGKDALAEMAANLDAADSALAEAEAKLAEGEYAMAGSRVNEAEKLLKKVSDGLSTGGTGGLM